MDLGVWGREAEPAASRSDAVQIAADLSPCHYPHLLGSAGIPTGIPSLSPGLPSLRGGSRASEATLGRWQNGHQHGTGCIICPGALGIRGTSIQPVPGCRGSFLRFSQGSPKAFGQPWAEGANPVGIVGPANSATRRRSRTRSGFSFMQPASAAGGRFIISGTKVSDAPSVSGQTRRLH